jgi:hypothetical protein
MHADRGREIGERTAVDRGAGQDARGTRDGGDHLRPEAARDANGDARHERELDAIWTSQGIAGAGLDDDVDTDLRATRNDRTLEARIAEGRDDLDLVTWVCH